MPQTTANWPQGQLTRARHLSFMRRFQLVKREKLTRDVTKTRNGERGTGNGERETGNGKRGTGNGSKITNGQRYPS